MPEYLLLIHEDEAAHARQSPHAMAELIVQHARFAERLREQGRLRNVGRFRPSSGGRRVSRQHGAVDLVANEDQLLAGYYWVEARSVDEASALARECPGLPSDEVEVRPVMKGRIAAEKERKSGKHFAFAVLGKTATETEWTEVMDRIDEETKGGFPSHAFLGGIRLEPPTSGRRVGTRGGHRAVFDGPFLESKEIIGGLFLMRHARLEDAVDFARGSRFVVHGTLEIRELWRI